MTAAIGEYGDSFEPQANPSTWFLLAFLLNFNLEEFFGPGSTATTWSSTGDISPELEYFFKIGIHQLPLEVQKERDLIQKSLEHWRQRLPSPPIHLSNLELAPHTSSGTYFDGIHSVIKPFDEDIACLNNPFFPGLPGAHLRVRPNIALYQGPQRECAAFEISDLLGLDVVPSTHLALIASPDFHDVTAPFQKGKWDEVLYMFNMEQKGAALMNGCGKPPPYKLCSVREYISGSTLSEWIELGSPEDIDPKDILAVNLAMWLFGNTDGHPGNILVYPKGVQENGRPLFGLQLIDLSLTFPESNCHMLNTLPDLIPFQSPLPQNWLSHYPLADVLAILDQHELFGAKQALQERIETLMLLISSGLSIEEINTRFKYLGQESRSPLNLYTTSHLTPLTTWTRV